MPALDVADEGLNALAGQCAVHAARLADHVLTRQPEPPLQATAAAVSTGYTAVAAAAAAMAARVQATGDNLTVAATHCVSTEGNSAQHLSALGDGPVTR